MASKSKRVRLVVWNREDITYCKCPEASYTHTHCPCEVCCGKAVSRSTEYRHWNEQLRLYNEEVDNPLGGADDNPSGEDSDEHSGQDHESGESGGGDSEDQDQAGCTCSVGGESGGDDSDDRLQDQLQAGCDVDGESGGNGEDNAMGSASADGIAGVSQVTNDIIKAVFKAMQINDEVCGSQQNFLSILQYGKELYCKGDSALQELWPSTWQGALRLMENNGYRSPKELFVCLSDQHPCSYTLLSSPDEECRICHIKGSDCIKYTYLPLADKIKRWCSDEIFCKKITAHWNQRDHWLNRDFELDIRKELWDGDRFAELSWFWDPSSSWILPASCPFCKTVVSSETIRHTLACLNIDQQHADGLQITLECLECHTKFSDTVKTTTGDPRNIVLIGHWDGWQPFSTSSKHSCGKYNIDHVPLCTYCYFL